MSATRPCTARGAYAVCFVVHSNRSETLDISSLWLGEMLEDDSADKFTSMGG